MAICSIDLDAMAALVKGMEAAQRGVPGVSGTISGHLSHVLLPTDTLRPTRAGSAVSAWLDAKVRDLNRRLALARLIAASSPGFGGATVSLDESLVSKTSQAEVERRANQAAGLIRSGDGKDSSALAALLEANETDPYFAQALAKKVSPATLDAWMSKVSIERIQRQPDTKAFDRGYDRTLNALGVTLGVASHGTGSLAVPGMAKQWADFLGDYDNKTSGGVDRLSLVIARGYWSTPFLSRTTTAMMDAEKGRGTGYWSVGQQIETVDPATGTSVLDPFGNIMTALTSNPDAVRSILVDGTQKTLTTGEFEHKQAYNPKTRQLEWVDQPVGRPPRSWQVNERLYTLMTRQWDDPRASEAFGDMLRTTIAAPPKAGAPAYQAFLAKDLQSVNGYFGELKRRADDKDGPWWQQFGHTVLDVAGLVPFIGEVADIGNAIWYSATGDKANAQMSMASAVPFIGWEVTGGKWAAKSFTEAELKAAEDSGRVIKPGHPGDWADASEGAGWSQRATRYQEQITGKPVGTVYRMPGSDVKFDAFKNGVLVDAKGPGYAKWIRSGEYPEWHRGGKNLISDARRQLRAANGIPVQWHVAEEEYAIWLREKFSKARIDIEVVHTPLKES